MSGESEGFESAKLASAGVVFITKVAVADVASEVGM